MFFRSRAFGVASFVVVTSAISTPAFALIVQPVVIDLKTTGEGSSAAIVVTNDRNQPVTIEAHHHEADFVHVRGQHHPQARLIVAARAAFDLASHILFAGRADVNPQVAYFDHVLIAVEMNRRPDDDARIASADSLPRPRTASRDERW